MEFTRVVAESKQQDAFMEVQISDGRKIRVTVFLDTGGRAYMKMHFKRQGVNHYESIVTTLEDGVHRLVQRGNRESM